MTNIAVKIKNLHKTFSNGWGKHTTIIDNLDLEIMDGEIFGYLGANGAGKTTTFKLLLGLIFPDRGDMLFWDRHSTEHQTRAMIGYLPENPYFYSYLTAQESLEFYASLFDMDKTVKKERVKKLLALVRLDHAENLQLRKFSRGMLQRIGIAQALINDPKLLILDEPMSGLDPMGRKEMRDIILNCRDKGKTIIFSTHIISDVEMICNRAGMLSEGKLQQIITMDDDNKDIQDHQTGINDNTGFNTNAWEIICKGNLSDLPMLENKKNIRHHITGNRNIIEINDKSMAFKIMDEIKKYDLDLISFAPRKKSMEDIYLTNLKNKESKNG